MIRVKVIDRRDLIVGAGAAAVLSALLYKIGPVGAQQAAKGLPPEAWQEDLRAIIGAAKPVETKITLDIADTSENGNTVPFALSTESPMTPEDHVKAFHVLATANPQPLVASFRLTPASGVASVSSRMRLIKSQDVIGIAEYSNGTYALGKRSVKVTIACCGF